MKLLTQENIIFLLVAALAYMMFTSSECKKAMKETGEKVAEKASKVIEGFENEEMATKDMTPPVNPELPAYDGNEMTPVGYNKQIAVGKGNGCDNLKFVSTNLLPKNDDNFDDSFAEFAPTELEGNYLPQFDIGMQSQELRNPSYDLRSEPQNPVESVCAWNNSTIRFDSKRGLNPTAKA